MNDWRINIQMNIWMMGGEWTDWGMNRQTIGGMIKENDQGKQCLHPM